MRKKTGNFIITGIWVVLFIAFTVLVQVLDVHSIGPQSSNVGFATVNSLVHEFLGVHDLWYTITEWLGFIPLSTAAVFAVIGLLQLIQRRSLFKVDASIIVLGIYYAIVIGVYVLFEFYIVNYRPILIDGYLEASYPSSHTMLECGMLVKDRMVNIIVRVISLIIMAVIVIGRLISGAHWFTDIIGGLLISGALIMGLYSVLSILPKGSDSKGSKGKKHSGRRRRY